MRFFFKPFLITLICILPYKAKSYTEGFNPEACKEALLRGRSDFLLEVFKAIEPDELEHFLKEQNYQEKMQWDLQNNVEVFFYYAIILGKPESIQTLVSELKLDVNIRDSEGRTPLHYAALNKDPLSRLDTIYALIKLGVNPETTDHLGNPPYFYVEKGKRPLYPKEQRLKGAELALPPYDIIGWPYLLGLFQTSSNSLKRWIKEYREENNMPVENSLPLP